MEHAHEMIGKKRYPLSSHASKLLASPIDPAVLLANDPDLFNCMLEHTLISLPHSFL